MGYENATPTPPAPADDASGAEAIAPVWRVELWAEQIRVAWVDWALTQPNPKPSWLVPWATLDEQSKDADRAIARRLLALYAVPLPPASAGEVETARIVGWAMCFVPFGHDDTAAKPKLIFDSKEHAEDVARRQTAFGIGEGARFVVRPITWAAERAASGDNKKGGA